MSKCEISIEFDRSDRTYRGGETVRGTARIKVLEDTNSKGIKLTYRWKTHGRGNTDMGPPETISMDGPTMLTAGEKLEFPFSVTANTFPVTYHGHMVSVDHYIQVEVDVPWSRNPSAEEDFILLPGARPPQMTDSRDAKISFKAPPAQAGLLLQLILWPLAAVLIVAIATFALFLLPIILIVGGWFLIKSRALASRLGTVEASIPHVVVAPGEEWPISIRFTPRKSFVINQITLQLDADESATSGSGTKSTTHNHKLYSQTHVLREGGQLGAGEVVDHQLTISFPASDAFSLEESSNKVKWTAKLRIDIPRFPDWTKSTDLQVVPIEFLSGSSVSQAKTLEDGTKEPSSQIFEDRSPSVKNEVGAQAESASWTQDANVSAAIPATIEELIAQLDAVGRNSSQRAAIIESASQMSYRVSILIDRIASSIGVINVDEDYANGQTVTGTINGTRQAIQVLTRPNGASELDGHRRGTVWETDVTVSGWDSLYNRISALQV